MKNYGVLFSCAVAMILSLVSHTAHSGGLDPFWKFHKEFNRMDGQATLQNSVNQQAELINVFIKTSNPESLKDRILLKGGRVYSVVGPIMTAALPEDAIEEAAGWPEVEYIEVAKPLTKKNDLSSADTGASSVHLGTNLDHGYDGTGVIVGVIDSGIDLSHPAFKDENGSSRVLYVWDQDDNSGRGPAEIASTYGTEHGTADIAANVTGHVDNDGHGTHVAGTAAGRDVVFGGVAPSADIIAVKYKGPSTYAEAFANTFTTYVADAAYYIFQKASSLGMPAVINISSGTNMGPHDGTSLFEQYLDALVEAGPGRSITVSAGNSSSLQYGQHIGYGAVPAINSATAIYGLPSTPYYFIDSWEAPDCNVAMNVALYQVGAGIINATGWVSSGNDHIGNWGPILYQVNRTEVSNSQNGKKHSYVAIIPDAAFDPSRYFFILVYSGTCSRIDAWTDPSNSSVVFGADSGEIIGLMFYPGDNVSNVTIPATADNVIAVGAYGMRSGWIDMDGITQLDNSIVVGDIVYFSSHGPALNNAQRSKPTITAPGAYTISTRSANASPDPRYIIDGYHSVMQGTSMASPHVAGVVALMLQAYPQLTYDEIIAYIQSTARGAGDGGIWGYGKIDAAAAVKAVLTDYPPVAESNSPAPGGSPSPDSGDNSAEGGEGEGGGGGGCHLAISNPSPVAPALLLLLLAFTGINVWRMFLKHRS